MSSIPAGLLIEIDPALIPPGPRGASVYETWLAAGNTGSEADFLEWMRANVAASPSVVKAVSHSSIAPGVNTAVSSTYVATGLKCSVGAQAGDKVLIDVRGMVNHTSQNIVHFTLRRNGWDLTPEGCTGLACARIDIADGVRAINFQHQDTVPESGVVEYELFWRCHNAGTAYLGRRPIDAAMMVPATMTLQVL